MTFLTRRLDVVKKTEVASWVSVAMLCLCAFLLLSYAVLPVKWSHRHYLNVFLVVGICIMQVSMPKSETNVANTSRSHSLSLSVSNQTNATTQ